MKYFQEKWYQAARENITALENQIKAMKSLKKIKFNSSLNDDSSAAAAEVKALRIANNRCQKSMANYEDKFQMQKEHIDDLADQLKLMDRQSIQCFNEIDKCKSTAKDEATRAEFMENQRNQDVVAAEKKTDATEKKLDDCVKRKESLPPNLQFSLYGAEYILIYLIKLLEIVFPDSIPLNLLFFFYRAE